MPEWVHSTLPEVSFVRGRFFAFGASLSGHDGVTIMRNAVRAMFVIANGARKVNNQVDTFAVAGIKPLGSEVKGRPMRITFRAFRQVFACGLAGAALLVITLPVSAQMRNTTSGASFTGSSGGSSGGLGGSSIGGSGGSSSASSGSFNLSSGFGSTLNGSSTSLNGTTTGTGSGSRSGSSSFTSSVNPLASYYTNPLAANMGATSGTTTGSTSTQFGSALYTVSTSSSSSLGGSSSGRGGSSLGGSSNSLGTAGVRTGTSGFGSTGTSGSSSFGSTSSSGYTYGPVFSVGSTFAPPSIPGGGAPILGGPPSRFQLQLQDTIQQSSRLSPESKSGISVAMDGGVVVLRGTVSNPGEAQLAMNLLSLTPGVRDIRSELTVR